MIVTYNHIDSSLYHKTTLLAKANLILPNLASVNNVNYDYKVCCKLNQTLQL
jgi:hypothetical protein